MRQTTIGTGACHKRIGRRKKLRKHSTKSSCGERLRGDQSRDSWSICDEDKEPAILATYIGVMVEGERIGSQYTTGVVDPEAVPGARFDISSNIYEFDDGEYLLGHPSHRRQPGIRLGHYT